MPEVVNIIPTNERNRLKDLFDTNKSQFISQYINQLLLPENTNIINNIKSKINNLPDRSIYKQRFNQYLSRNGGNNKQGLGVAMIQAVVGLWMYYDNNDTKNDIEKGIMVDGSFGNITLQFTSKFIQSDIVKYLFLDDIKNNNDNHKRTDINNLLKACEIYISNRILRLQQQETREMNNKTSSSEMNLELHGNKNDFWANIGMLYTTNEYFVQDHLVQSCISKIIKKQNINNINIGVDGHRGNQSTAIAKGLLEKNQIRTKSLTNIQIKKEIIKLYEKIYNTNISKQDYQYIPYDKNDNTVHEKSLQDFQNLAESNYKITMRRGAVLHELFANGVFDEIKQINNIDSLKAKISGINNNTNYKRIFHGSLLMNDIYIKQYWDTIQYIKTKNISESFKNLLIGTILCENGWSGDSQGLGEGLGNWYTGEQGGLNRYEDNDWNNSISIGLYQMQIRQTAKIMVNNMQYHKDDIYRNQINDISRNSKKQTDVVIYFYQNLMNKLKLNPPI